MDAVLLALSARSDYHAQIQAALSDIQSSLAVIKNKQDDFKEYQKTCEAERKAHEIRLAALENSRSNSDASRKTLLSLFGGVGGIASLLVSLVTIYTLIKHG